jgi:hypothetical protein
LPVLVGQLFGFRKQLLILNHLDLADIVIGSHPPFEEAAANLFLVEIVKVLMVPSSFIVSCKDSSTVLNLFPPMSETPGLDLTDGLSFVSTLDVVPLPAEPQKEIVISFDGDEPQIALSVRHFGGCPAYLQMWAEINRYADDVEAAVQNNGDPEEPRLFLNGSLEAALRQLFVRADGTPLELTVRSATRIDPRGQIKS